MARRGDRLSGARGAHKRRTVGPDAGMREKAGREGKEQMSEQVNGDKETKPT